MTGNLLILSLAIGAPALKDAKPTVEAELARLKGQWVRVAESVDGEPEVEPPSPALTLVCDGGTFSYVLAQEDWTIQLGQAATPKATDLLIYIRGRLNETIRLIYELDVDKKFGDRGVVHD